MRRISAQVEIEAPPERVWDVLADFESYAEWNPFMESVTGQALRGAWLRISLRGRGGHRLRFKARVLAWEGRGWAWWPGLLHGERQITIEPSPAGRSRVRMQTWMRWLDHYRPSFEEMELALKRKAEGSQ